MKEITFQRLKKHFLNLIITGMIIIISSCSTNFTKTTTSNNYLPTLVSPKINPTPTSTIFLTNTPLATQELTFTPIQVHLDPNYWEPITSPSEVPDLGIVEISQAKDGTMWFRGWSYGMKILQYDDKNWKIYDPKDIPAFHSKVIDSLAIAPDGTVWVGTRMNEIVSFDGNDWKSQTVEEGGYRTNDIDSIVIRKNGELCAISIESMSCKRLGKWIRYPIVISNNVNRVYVTDVILSRSDEIWVPLDNGLLYHYDGKNWTSSKVSEWIGPVALGKDDSLWIFDKEGLGKRDISGNITYQEFPYVLFEYPPFVMYESDDGTVWIGCGGGGDGYELIIKKGKTFEDVDGKVLEINHDRSYLSSYPFGDVYTIFQSKDGAIWLGTFNGIFRYHSN